MLQCVAIEDLPLLGPTNFVSKNMNTPPLAPCVASKDSRFLEVRMPLNAMPLNKKPRGEKSQKKKMPRTEAKRP